METTLGLIALAVAAAVFVPLRRLLRSPARPRWLHRPLLVEHVLLAHVALVTAAIALLIDGLGG